MVIKSIHQGDSIMYTINRFFPLILIGLLLFLVLCPGPATAINVVGSKYMETVHEGETVTHMITVNTKATDPPMDIIVEVMGFGQTEGKSYSALSAAEDTSPYSAREFITLDTGSFHLNPGESRTITATMVIPKDVGDGGRYAIISLRNAPAGDGTTAYVTAISIPVMITIAGSSLQETGTITDIKAGGSVAGQPLHIITSFKNTGNVHYYKTTNAVTVSDSGGNVLGTASTEPSIFAIIPPYTVVYDATLDNSLSPGTYSVKSELIAQDGTRLDVKTAEVEVRSIVLAAPTQGSENNGQPLGQKSPVPGTTVLLALGLIVMVSATWMRRNK